MGVEGGAPKWVSRSLGKLSGGSAAALQFPRGGQTKLNQPPGGCRGRHGENRGRCARRAGPKLQRRLPRSCPRWVSPTPAGARPPPTPFRPGRHPLLLPPLLILSASLLLSPPRAPASSPSPAPGQTAGTRRERRARAGFQRPRPIPAQPGAASRPCRDRGVSSRPRPPRAGWSRAERSGAQPSRGCRAREAAAAWRRRRRGAQVSWREPGASGARGHRTPAPSAPSGSGRGDHWQDGKQSPEGGPRSPPVRGSHVRRLPPRHVGARSPAPLPPHPPSAGASGRPLGGGTAPCPGWQGRSRSLEPRSPGPEAA